MTDRKRLSPKERKEVVSRIAKAVEENQRMADRKELAHMIGKAVEEKVLATSSQLWERMVGFAGSFDVEVPESRVGKALSLKIKVSRSASWKEVFKALSPARSIAIPNTGKTYAERVEDLQERAMAANAREATMYPNPHVPERFSQRSALTGTALPSGLGR